MSGDSMSHPLNEVHRVLVLHVLHLLLNTLLWKTATTMGYRETNTKCKCLPVAVELLATCGTEREATHKLDQRGHKDERDDSCPLWDLCAHWNKLLLLGLQGDCAGLINHDLGGVIVARVAS
jgi:hypothetical protein